MKTGRVGLFALVAVIALSSFSPPPARAFVAPLQDVTYSVAQENGWDKSITFSVWDPTLMADVSVTRTDFDAITSYKVSEGIVAFVRGKILECWVFDPIMHQWVGDTWNIPFSNYPNIYGKVAVNSGVVTCFNESGQNLFWDEWYPGDIFPNTYDPQHGWVHGSPITAGNFPANVNQDGMVVVWARNGHWDEYYNPIWDDLFARAMIYDPRDGQWKTWSLDCTNAYPNFGDFSIETTGANAIFKRNGTTIAVASYDTANHALVNKPILSDQWTKPLSYFFAAPVSGQAPLTIWFMDLSIGGTDGCTYDFGDGSSSTFRSGSHAYLSGGYTLSQTVTNPYMGTATSSQGITVQGNPLPGYLGINHGAQWTNQRTVYLNLTTEVGAMIALKNGANSTYGTEFLYDPVADANLAYNLWPFLLPIGYDTDTTYTIYAKFRNAANNTFETSASIKADTHKPNLPTLTAHPYAGKMQINLDFPGGITDGYYTYLGLNKIWHPGSGIAWWRINRGTSPSNINLTVYGSLGAPTFSSCADTYQLQKNQTYYYQLLAQDNAGNLISGPVVPARLSPPLEHLKLMLFDD